ncbi:MAG: GTPase HflX [Pseudomonadota bacterium]
MRALLLHPDLTKDPNRRDAMDALAEGESLARALGDIDLVLSEVVRLRDPQAGLLFGKGKLEEIAELIAEHEIGLVLINGSVSPIQQRNLERHWKVKLLDRTGLILEIFAARARTREGVLQVELAALEYQKTRLVRSWTHLERQRGGLGFVGGAGETQIEADRRAIDDAIVRLKRQLSKVVKTRELHRAARKKVPYPIVALVGYTNAGKSTLFNALTGANVMSKDMVFATLDPTMREVKLAGGLDVILSDTVGFISDLPTSLVAAFRATLEEVLEADLVLHVRDMAHAETDRQADDVAEVLTELGLTEKDFARFVEVWNKTDLLTAEQRAFHQNIAERRDTVVQVSAVTGEGLENLVAVIDKSLRPTRHSSSVRLAHSEGHRRAWLYENVEVVSEDVTDTGMTLNVLWSDRDHATFKRV